MGWPRSLLRSSFLSLEISRRQLVAKLGQLLKFRQGLNLNRENFYDTPDLYWAEPVLESATTPCKPFTLTDVP